MNQMQVIAHRGASGLVSHDNSAAAFEMAIQLGADWVEMDVRKTADDALVVLHDADIAGLPVERLPLTRARRRAAAVGRQLLTLGEVVDLCFGRIRMDIELKVAGIEAATLGLLAPIQREQWLVKSFVDDVVGRIKHLDPSATTGLVVGRGSRDPRILVPEVFPERRLDRVGADIICPHYRLLKARFVWRMKRRGTAIWVWTVNEPRMMAQLTDCGVDGLITDRPDLALGQREHASP